MRPLRLLPARLPHLSELGSGDGLAARPHLPDEGLPRGARLTLGGRGAHRPLPGLSRLRHGLPVGREIRPADRADARRARTDAPAIVFGSAAARADLRRVPLPRAAACAGAARLVVRREWA